MSISARIERALDQAVAHAEAPGAPPLLAAARQRGNPTVNGLGMLLHQARPAFEAWFGVAPEITTELRAAVEAAIR